LSCVSDHPFGFEWCVNAPAVDVNGIVYANSEDGNLYEILNGVVVNQVFTQLAIGAAYTPLSIGPDGRIYTQNDGRLFVVGNDRRRSPRGAPRGPLPDKPLGEAELPQGGDGALLPRS